MTFRLCYCGPLHSTKVRGPAPDSVIISILFFWNRRSKTFPWPARFRSAYWPGTYTPSPLTQYPSGVRWFAHMAPVAGSR